MLEVPHVVVVSNVRPPVNTLSVGIASYSLDHNTGHSEELSCISWQSTE